MPRSARIIMPNHPHHVIQRGHNQQTVFTNDDHYRYYLDNLAEWKEALDCKIFAFCLMPNHVHLVIDPGGNPENLGKLMKRVAGRQTRYANRVEGRSGTLWEGRYKSSPIDKDNYLLACCRYVEMNPVAAGICDTPAAYPWSSCRSKIEARKFAWLDFDPLYLAFGDSERQRQRRYRAFLAEKAPEPEKVTIVTAVHRGQLTGGAAFIDEVEERLKRRVELRGQGRPRKG
jgi:putative transposase